MRHGRHPSTTIKSLAATAAGPGPASPPPPPSNSPSPAYRQHHAVEDPHIDAATFHPAWRVKSRLLGLAEAGRIDRRQLEAALTWRGWCEAIGRQPVQSWEIRINRSPLSGTPTPYQSLAAGQLRAAAAVLGPDRTRLLEWSVVDDMNWIDIGKKIGLSDKTAIGRVIEAIGAMARRQDGAGPAAGALAHRAAALVMRSFPSRPATSPLWSSPDNPPAPSPPAEEVLVATVVRALSELLVTPATPAMVQTVNRELARRRCLYRLRRPGGPQRR